MIKKMFPGYSMKAYASKGYMKKENNENNGITIFLVK